MKKTIRFLITGVGGQGTILASDILAEVGLRLGHDAKKSDILGSLHTSSAHSRKMIYMPEMQ